MNDKQRKESAIEHLKQWGITAESTLIFVKRAPQQYSILIPIAGNGYQFFNITGFVAIVIRKDN